MKKINYKSDFDFLLRLTDCKGDAMPFPDCDWDAEFWTSNKPNAYRASCIGGEYVNCFREADGSIHFVFNNHRMGKGTLKWEPHFRFPNDIYPDGFQDQFRKAQLGIELVDGDGDCPTQAEIEAVLPVIKGDKGDKLTYTDLTEADKEDLRRPLRDEMARLAERLDRLESRRSIALE